MMDWFDPIDRDTDTDTHTRRQRQREWVHSYSFLDNPVSWRVRIWQQILQLPGP